MSTVERGLPAALRFEHVPTWVILVACYAALNLGLGLYFTRFGPQAGDWQLWESLPARLGTRELYDEAGFVWSPLAAVVMAGVVQVGYWPWFGVHLAAVPFLRDWRLIGLTLLSWPFWHDAAEGNTMTFVFVAGALALRGSRPAALVYLTLLLLMPRPVQLPLAAWLLWRTPEMRLPFVALFAAHAGAVVWTGYAVDWVTAMTTYGQEGALVHTIGPARFIGLGWLLIGIPLGLWLFARGRVGLSGLAISPYWLPGYLLMWLLELVPRPDHATGAPPPPARASRRC